MSRIPPRLRFEILERDGYRCRYCGRGAPAVALHIDHVHPKSEHGTDDPANLVTACEDCNLGKGARVLGAPVPGAGEGVKTFPHLDLCPQCPDDMYVPAYREEPTQEPKGYKAWYRCAKCECRWFTCWSNSMRMTAEELQELAEEPIA